jgi:hypothetical protein
VVSWCECGDEPLSSGAMELVIISLLMEHPVVT